MSMTKTRIIRTYSELMSLSTFEERFKYLQLNGSVGSETFGYDRYLNQAFYGKSQEWKDIRDYVIIRDNGCDLGMEGYEIQGRIYVHHMNPVNVEDIIHKNDILINPEFLICTTHNTHNAIHYGDEGLLIPNKPIIRTENDTCPWRH